MMVTDHLQMHQAHLRWIVAAAGLRPKDPVHLADQPGDDCSEEECSNEEEIPYPSAEQVTAKLLPLTVSLGASVSAFASNISVKHLHPEPSIAALTLKYTGCTKKEKLLASSDEEELLSAHGITGKISRVHSGVFSSSKPLCLGL